MAPSFNTQPAVAVRRIHATAQQLSPAVASTSTNYPTTHDKIEKINDTPYFIDNTFVNSTTQ